MNKKILILLISFLLPLLSIFITKEEFFTREELEATEEIILGLPIPFYHQGVPEIDPPLPWKVGFSFWEYRHINIINYLLSVIVTFIVLICLYFFYRYLRRRI